MMTRRFTMVCLICMIFGIVLSNIVTSTARTGHSQTGPGTVHCIGDKSVRCAVKAGE